jgi:hypothetical protein
MTRREQVKSHGAAHDSQTDERKALRHDDGLPFSGLSCEARPGAALITTPLRNRAPVRQLARTKPAPQLQNEISHRNSFCASSTPRAQKELQENEEYICVFEARRRLGARQLSNPRTTQL